MGTFPAPAPYHIVTWILWELPLEERPQQENNPQTQRVPVPNIEGLRSQKPYLKRILEPESLNIGYLEPLGQSFCPRVWWRFRHLQMPAVPHSFKADPNRSKQQIHLRPPESIAELGLYLFCPPVSLGIISWGQAGGRQ